MLTLFLILAAFLLLLNAFFVLAEFSAVKMRSTHIEALAQSGSRRARLLKVVHSRLDVYLSVCQVGITLSSIGLGFVGEPAFVRLITPLAVRLGVSDPELLHTMAFILAYALVSFLHILLGELVPKSIAIRMTTRSALFTAPILRVFYWLFLPALWLLNSSADILLRLIRIPRNASSERHSEDEVRIILGQTEDHGLISFRRLLFLENVLDLGELKVFDAMRPSEQVSSLSLHMTPEAVRNLILEKRYSRYPVCDPTKPDPLGFIHVKDLFFSSQRGEEIGELHRFIRPLLFVQDSASLEEVLVEMQRRPVHMAAVRNPSGRWVGILTLEDAQEEIVGTVEEEYPTETPLLLSAIITPERIALSVRGHTLSEVLATSLASFRGAALPARAEELLHSLLTREALGSTYLGNGIAMPHARLPGIATPVVLILRPHEPYPVGSSKELVRILFVLITPAGMPRIHQRIQARLAGILASDYAKERLLEASSAEELRDTLLTAEQTVLAGNG